MIPTLSYLSNFDLLSVSMAVAAMGVLGFIVFLQNRKSATNRHFFYLSLAIILWSTTNYLAYQLRSSFITLWLLRFLMFFAVWFAFAIFSFLYIFPREDKKFPRWYKRVFIPLTIITSILCLTPLVFNKILEMAPVAGASRVANGPAIILFGLTVFVFNIGGVIIFIKRTIQAPNKEKLHYKYILCGIFVTLVLILFFNFILPAFFDNPRFIPLGAIFVFPFIALTSYAILRYRLFNLRVAGAGVLVFLLSVIAFSEVILARDVTLIIYRSIVFLFVLIFGILLIRAVLREVRQREKITILAEKLRIANIQLKKLDHAKSEFLSIASHQLYTPLTAIRGYLSMILEGDYGKVPKKQREVIALVMESGNRLVELIKNLLDISRIESGLMKYKFEPTNLAEMAEDIVREQKPNALKKNLALTYHPPEAAIPRITVDRERMRQVFMNLVDNAIKYTNEGRVDVFLQKIGDYLLFKVQDTGIGIDKEAMPVLFKKFSRADGTWTMNVQGTGLGLYVAKQLVEEHGGKIWAESKGKGKGSTFIVRLPIKFKPKVPGTEKK